MGHVCLSSRRGVNPYEFLAQAVSQSEAGSRANILWPAAGPWSSGQTRTSGDVFPSSVGPLSSLAKAASSGHLRGVSALWLLSCLMELGAKLKPFSTVNGLRLT